MTHHCRISFYVRQMKINNWQVWSMNVYVAFPSPLKKNQSLHKPVKLSNIFQTKGCWNPYYLPTAQFILIIEHKQLKSYCTSVCLLVIVFIVKIILFIFYWQFLFSILIITTCICPTKFITSSLFMSNKMWSSRK